MSRQSIYQKYLEEICRIYAQAESTEVSYYPALKTFLENFSKQEKNLTGIIIQPRKTEIGIPDFVLKTEKGKIIGYIEAKVPDKNIYSLTKQDQEQLERYKTLPNLIYTNFIDFILYRNGEKIKEVRITQPVNLKLKSAVPQKIDEFNDLLNTFFDFSIPTITTAENLAKELAKRTKLLSYFVLEELKYNSSSSVNKFFKTFQEELIPSLNIEQFSDMYSQTITYGLFFARIRAYENEFSRINVAKYIPQTIPLLRTLFYYITGPDLPESLSWIIEDIANILEVTNIDSILKDFHTTKWTDDPVIHFYETFLEVYNPKEREKRGVYYTPAPVVSYIINSIHKLLKTEFKKEDGLADKSVTLLDPAAGTLTFPATAIRLVHRELVEKGKGGIFPQLVKEHILKNFYAFELMVAPYAIGHFKISVVLEDLGYEIDKNERFNLYLTNTLEIKDIKQINMPFISELANEGIAAKKVKSEIPILVITGNPPYSVSSENKSDFIEQLMQTYKEDVKDEKNIQPLSDDYIKFIRFAQWKIEQGGFGIVGMITNNSYLSGLIHRGMRKKLLECFDKIYILNLHGNSRIGEKCPDGSKDENVFDIMQGVSIALFVKTNSKTKDVYYADLWGLREKKYKYLETHDVTNTKWQKLNPTAPYYFFVPKEFYEEEKYKKFWSVTKIFLKFNRGVVTSRDHFIVSFNRQKLYTHLRIFTDKKLSDDFVSQSLSIHDTRTWKIKNARERVIKKGIDEKLFREYLYRPFDIRWIYYEDILLERSRKEIMINFFKENLGLLLMRQVYLETIYSHFLVTNLITDSRVFLSNRGAADIFPLYLYIGKSKIKTKYEITEELFKEQYQEKIPNFSKEFILKLESTYNKKLSPEEIFYYIYAILYSNIYRKKYQEFLKIDFPRVPFTSDYKIFQNLAKLGEELVLIHLLKSPSLNSLKAKYPVSGTDKVEKITYDEKKECVYINKQQYFADVPKEVWEYYIGGYQVLEKWLKERKGLKLSLEDIEHYMKIITAIKYTIKIQKEIDKIYPKIEENLIE